MRKLVDPSCKAKVIELYERNEKVTDIAKQVKCARGTVYEILKKAGVDLRPPALIAAMKGETLIWVNGRLYKPSAARFVPLQEVLAAHLSGKRIVVSDWLTGENVTMELIVRAVVEANKDNQKFLDHVLKFLKGA